MTSLAHPVNAKNLVSALRAVAPTVVRAVVGLPDSVCDEVYPGLRYVAAAGGTRGDICVAELEQVALSLTGR